MTPHGVKHISPENQALFARVEHIMDCLPDLDLGINGQGEPIPVSCHMLCRAIGQVLQLKYVDGMYGGTCAHSWLETPDYMCVIDVYPVAALGGPTIIDSSFPNFPGRTLYKKTRRFYRTLNFSTPLFRRSVRRLVREVRRINEANRVCI